MAADPETYVRPTRMQRARLCRSGGGVRVATEFEEREGERRATTVRVFSRGGYSGVNFAGGLGATGWRLTGEAGKKNSGDCWLRL